MLLFDVPLPVPCLILYFELPSPKSGYWLRWARLVSSHRAAMKPVVSMYGIGFYAYGGVLSSCVCVYLKFQFRNTNRISMYTAVIKPIFFTIFRHWPVFVKDKAFQSKSNGLYYMKSINLLLRLWYYTGILYYPFELGVQILLDGCLPTTNPNRAT